MFNHVPGNLTLAAARRHYKRLTFFFLLWAVAGILAIWRASPGGYVDTDMFNLLPAERLDPTVLQAVETLRHRAERAYVILISSPERAIAMRAAKNVALRLRESGLFADVIDRTGANQLKQLVDFYRPFRMSLLTSSRRELISSASSEVLVRDLLKRLYSPLYSSIEVSLADDPLLLSNEHLSWVLHTIPSSLAPDDGMLAAHADGRYHVVIFANLVDSPFTISAQDGLQSVLSRLRSDTGVEGRWTLRSMGIANHVIAGSRQARAEIRTVGLGSLLGIFLLLLVTFRGVRAHAAVVVSIATGICIGFLVCLAVFGQVHLLTLVGGSSLIGVAVDYSFHVLSDRFRQRGPWRIEVALDYTMPAIRLGLTTSIVGFGSFLASGFPGLQQIGIFSSFGLVGAFFGVYCLFPLLFADNQRTAPRTFPIRLAGGLAEASFSTKWSGARLVLLILFSGLVVIGWVRADFDDDVRNLSSRNLALAAEDSIVDAVTGGVASSQFFLVEAETVETLLQAEEALRPALEHARQAGALSGYAMTSHFVPSMRRQREDLKLVRRYFEGAPSPFEEVVSLIGLDPTVGEATRREAMADSDRMLTLDLWMGSPISEPFRHLWLDDGPRSVVGLYGVSDLDSLYRLADASEGVRFVDPVALLSQMLGDYRKRAILILAVAYVAIAVVLMIRLGPNAAFRCLCVPGGTALITFGVLGLLGEPLTLFHVIALALALGVGVDYVIFFSQARADRAATSLAVTLSASSTMLAFGLLAFSQVGALHAIGITVLVGVTTSFVLAVATTSGTAGS